MARFFGQATISELALTAATAKTVLQGLAATNHRVAILSWGVFFDGTSTIAEPVQVVLMRQTTVIGGTPTVITPTKRDDSIAETLLTTFSSSAGGAEPTSGDVLAVKEVHPQQGYELWYPMGWEIVVGGSDRIGIVCTAPAGVNVRAEFVFEE